MKHVVVLALVLGGIGCKQGLNDHCQITADCESPLTCNQATQTCQDKGGANPIDAMVPVFIDAALDAKPDAPPDAP